MSLDPLAAVSNLPAPTSAGDYGVYAIGGILAIWAAVRIYKDLVKPTAVGATAAVKALPVAVNHVVTQVKKDVAALKAAHAKAAEVPAAAAQPTASIGSAPTEQK